MTEYVFKNEPLQALMCAELLPNVVTPGKYTRKELFETVLAYHIKNGGLAPRAVNPAKIIQKALDGLKELGAVRKASAKGMWEVLSKDEQLVEVEAELLDDDLELDEVVAEANDVSEGAPATSSIYLCYPPTYRKLAELEHNPRYHCKVGKADNPDERIRTLSTGSPEKLVKGLAHVSDKALELEEILKRLLRFHGRKVPDSGGDEWFFTNADELEKLIASVESRDWMSSAIGDNLEIASGQAPDSPESTDSDQNSNMV